MTTNEFVEQAAVYLKQLGYKKTRRYWHQVNGELVYCVFVQVSQWNSDDYYVEVGIALLKEAGPRPTLGHWLVRKRCTCGKNISLQEMIRGMKFFDEISSAAGLETYLEHTPHIQLGCQIALYSDEEQVNERLE